MNTSGHSGAVRFGTIALAAALAGGLALFWGCENSDPTAPEGSSITVTADPQTVQAGVQSLIVATVRSANGTRLPDQEVIFTTSTGTLSPTAQTPIITDQDGFATSILTTTQTATVTGASGTISDTTTVNVVNCQLQSILINVTPQTITNCITQVALKLTALDTNGVGCAGVAVSFRQQASTQGNNTLTGTINPIQGATDANGEFTATFTPDQGQCSSSCSAVTNPTNNQCAVAFVGEEFSGSQESIPVDLIENIP